MTDRRTPLYGEHVALGARMIPFSGWEMPVQYAGGIVAEHLHTRSRASLFDICHMGEFRIAGPRAAASLDALLARPSGDLPTGACRYNFLLNDDGGVADDVIVYRLAPDEFMVVVNAATRGSDAARFQAAMAPGAFFEDISDDTAKLDLQGPATWDVLARLGLPHAKVPAYYRHAKASLAGFDLLLSRTGYTGEMGVELYLPAAQAVGLWRAILDVPGVLPAGLGARDTLRLEMGYPLYGHELDPDTTPLEAGFGRLIDLRAERAFPGRDALRSRPLRKRLVGIAMRGRRAARAGMAVLDAAGEPVGRVTSGAFSPSLERAVALALAAGPEPLPPGTPLLVDVGGRSIEGEAADLPFHKEGTARMPPPP